MPEKNTRTAGSAFIDGNKYYLQVFLEAYLYNFAR